jgi:hypothetical protein
MTPEYHDCAKVIGSDAWLAANQIHYHNKEHTELVHLPSSKLIGRPKSMSDEQWQEAKLCFGRLAEIGALDKSI